MSKKEELKKEYKVNLNYLEFINSLNKDKIEVNSLNKEEIEKRYNEIVNLKFSNIKKVSMRNRRKEVIEKRNKYLLDNFKLSEKDYNNLDKKLNSISNKKSLNYL